MTWYEQFVFTPVRALNEIRSNVWSVILVIVGISLVLKGHENVGSSLVTGAFAVFRSSSPETAPGHTTTTTSQSVVTDPKVKPQ